MRPGKALFGFGIVTLALWPAVAALVLAGCGNGDGVPGDAVARVGAITIRKADFDHWLAIAVASQPSSAPTRKPSRAVALQPPDFTACVAEKKAAAPKVAKGRPPITDATYRAQCQRQYAAVVQQVMQFLVSSRWIQGEASDENVMVSDAQVNQRFQTLRQRQFPTSGAFQKFLVQSGMSLQDLLFRVRLSMLSAKIQAKVTKGSANVTNTEVARYYERYKTRFAQPERRDLRLVLTKARAEADSAKSQLRSGKSFASVASKLSIDPRTRLHGGELIGAARAQFRQPLGTALFSARTGALEGPVKTPEGFYVFMIQKITPASRQTLAQATAEIRQLLLSTKRQSLLTAFSTRFRKKWIPRTNCRSGFVTAGCKNYKAPQVGKR